jgi:cation diffusion facilitator family transporter
MSGLHREFAHATNATDRGIWALQVSFLGLLATALVQAVVVAITQSAGLLADTLHNFGDALTSLPLWIAFALARRSRTRRFSYGYHRAEDLAGLVILIVILLSALAAGYESVRRLLSHATPQAPFVAMIGAAIGFFGNEAVAHLRIRVGKEIGSAALVADGQHARLDGLTSLAALLGLVGVVLGFPRADPIAGLAISVAILAILWEIGRDLLSRVMDAIDPQIVEAIETTAREIPGVREVYDLRARWRGHEIVAELTVSVDGGLSVAQGHQISEEVRHRLLHEIPNLADATLHVDPFEDSPGAHHRQTAHHFDRKG